MRPQRYHRFTHAPKKASRALGLELIGSITAIAQRYSAES